MALEVLLDRSDVKRIVLEIRSEGVYINIFDSNSASWPIMDYLAENMEAAKSMCEEDYAVAADAWLEVPDGPWHAPGEPI